jgi:hypothetical protein
MSRPKDRHEPRRRAQLITRRGWTTPSPTLNDPSQAAEVARPKGEAFGVDNECCGEETVSLGEFAVVWAGKGVEPGVEKEGFRDGKFRKGRSAGGGGRWVGEDVIGGSSSETINSRKRNENKMSDGRRGRGKEGSVCG